MSRPLRIQYQGWPLRKRVQLRCRTTNELVDEFEFDPDKLTDEQKEYFLYLGIQTFCLATAIGMSRTQLCTSRKFNNMRKVWEKLVQLRKLLNFKGDVI